MGNGNSQAIFQDFWRQETYPRKGFLKKITMTLKLDRSFWQIGNLNWQAIFEDSRHHETCQRRTFCTQIAYCSLWNSVTHPKFWSYTLMCHRRYDHPSPEMYSHPQRSTSPERVTLSPGADKLDFRERYDAFLNFGIYDTTESMSSTTNHSNSRFFSD